LSRVASRQFRLLTANNAAMAEGILRRCTAYVLSRFRIRSSPHNPLPAALSTRSPDVRRFLCQFRPCTRQLSFPTSVYFLVHPTYPHPFPLSISRPSLKGRGAKSSRHTRMHRSPATITQMTGGWVPRVQESLFLRPIVLQMDLYRAANDCDFQFFLPHLSRVQRVP